MRNEHEILPHDRTIFTEKLDRNLLANAFKLNAHRNELQRVYFEASSAICKELC